MASCNALRTSGSSSGCTCSNGPADELGRRESGESLDRIGYESNRAVGSSNAIGSMLLSRSARRHPLALLHFALAFATHPHHLKTRPRGSHPRPLCISLQKIPSGSLGRSLREYRVE